MKGRVSGRAATTSWSALACVDQILTWAEVATLGVAVAAIFVIMLLVFCDATLRYTINRPLSFSSDLIILYLISAAIFPALSYTLRRGGHVNVDLFAAMFPRRVFHGLIGVALLGAAAVTGVIAFKITGMAWDDWVTNEVQTGVYAWPMWPSKAIVAVGIVMFAIRLLHIGATSLIAAATEDYSHAIPIATIHDDTLEEAL